MDLQHSRAADDQKSLKCIGEHRVMLVEQGSLAEASTSCQRSLAETSENMLDVCKYRCTCLGSVANPPLGAVKTSLNSGYLTCQPELPDARLARKFQSSFGLEKTSLWAPFLPNSTDNAPPSLLQQQIMSHLSPTFVRPTGVFQLFPLLLDVLVQFLDELVDAAAAADRVLDELQRVGDGNL